MREQFEHLLKLTDLPNVVVQVLPFAAGMHSGQMGAFTILECADGSEVVWQEGQDGGHGWGRPVR